METSRKDRRARTGRPREETAEERAERMRVRAKELGLDVKIEAEPMADKLAGQTVLFFGPIAKDGYNRDVPRTR